MSTEKARLLIRAANQVSGESDRKALLAWAEEVLVEEEGGGRSSRAKGDFPVAVFRRYKGKLHQGRLLEGGRIQYDGKVYGTPSGAAVAISGHPENGWRMWRYIDESTNTEQPIEKLRNR